MIEQITQEDLQRLLMHLTSRVAKLEIEAAEQKQSIDYQKVAKALANLLQLSLTLHYENGASEAVHFRAMAPEWLLLLEAVFGSELES